LRGVPEPKLLEELVLIQAYAETYRDGKPTGTGSVFGSEHMSLARS
jgi:hypothetical protein